jgi:hypothetical protein
MVLALTAHWCSVKTQTAGHSGSLWEASAIELRGLTERFRGSLTDA